MPAPRLVLPFFLLLPAMAPFMAGQEPPAEEPGPSLELRGRLTFQYRWRDASLDDRDQDVLGWLSLDLGHADRNAVTASLAIRGAWDLEGDPSGPSRGSLSGLEDTRGGALDWRLRHAWLSLNDFLPGASLRLGRQDLFDLPVLLRLDGARLDLPADPAGAELDLALYGGLPYHDWDASRNGEAAGGAAATLRAWPGGSLRLDLLHVQDATVFGGARDTLLQVALRQGAADGSAWFRGAWSWLDGDNHEASAAGAWSDTALDLQISLQARALLARQAFQTEELDPFTAILLAEEPHQEGQVVLSKGFASPPLGERWQVDLGASGRRLQNNGRASEFNREYGRLWVSLLLQSLAGADLTLTGESWASETDSIRTAGLELELRPWDGGRLTLGSAYSAYRFDFFSRLERTGVRDVHLRLRQEVTAGLRLRLDLEYLEDDLERFPMALVQLELRF